MTNSIILQVDPGVTAFLLITFVAIPILFLAVFLPIVIVNNNYKKFVIANSKALKTLRDINSKYEFYVIPNFDMKHSYDNEHFYNDISPYDYLTYQLSYEYKKVNKAIKETLINKGMYKDYTDEIKDKCVFGDFGDTELPRNTKKLNKIEEEIFKKEMLSPVIHFNIKVTLVRTNINGDRQERKSDTFKRETISDIIYRLGQKRDNYYQDKNIWDSICRVERGKVTNKMRFAIYNRDGYRCRYCGRKTDDLEIDHIIPIAKGGKSTLDNLQTLCHRCNVKKGTDIY